MNPFESKPTRTDTISGVAGFTLVEIMVSAGIAGILALAFSTLFLNQQRSSQNIQLSADAIGLTSNLLQVVLNPAACGGDPAAKPPIPSAFQDAKGNVIAVNPAILAAGGSVPVFQVALAGGPIAVQGQPGTGLQVTKMAFNKLLSKLPDSGTNHVNLVNFHVDAQKIVQGIPNFPWSKDITVTLYTDTKTNLIQACSGASDLASGPSSWQCTVRATLGGQGPGCASIPCMAIGSCVGNEKVVNVTCSPGGTPFVNYASVVGGNGSSSATTAQGGSCLFPPTGGPGGGGAVILNCCQ